MSIVRVVAAVIVRDGKVFAARRAPNKSLAGLWEFPGGKVEPGETDQEALTREIAEELGVKVIVRDYLATSFSRGGDGDIELVAYFTQLISDEIRFSSDHDQLRWMTAAELLAVAWAPADLSFLPKIFV